MPVCYGNEIPTSEELHPEKLYLVIAGFFRLEIFLGFLNLLFSIPRSGERYKATYRITPVDHVVNAQLLIDLQ